MTARAVPAVPAIIARAGMARAGMAKAGMAKRAMRRTSRVSATATAIRAAADSSTARTVTGTRAAAEIPSARTATGNSPATAGRGRSTMTVRGTAPTHRKVRSGSMVCTPWPPPWPIRRAVCVACC